MSFEKVGISLPKPLLDEIDILAAKWYSGRSNAIVRIFQEWKAFKEQEQEQPDSEIIPTIEEPAQ